MKSLIVSTFWPAWEWSRKPTTRWIYSAYDQQLSNKSAKKMSELVKCEWYQERWGKRCSFNRQNLDQVQNFENTSKGSRLSVSVGSNVTGFHANRLVFDDLVKAQDAFKPNVMDAAWDYWAVAMSTRGLADVSMVGIAQRLSDNDVPGRCIASGDYVVLSLPMEYNPQTHCNFVIPCQLTDPDGFFGLTTITGDPRGGMRSEVTLEDPLEDTQNPLEDAQTSEGTEASQNPEGSPVEAAECLAVEPTPAPEEMVLLWPALKPRAMVEALKKSLGPVNAAAQLDQDPVPPGGVVFKLEDFQRTWPEPTIPESAQWIMVVDATFEDEKTAASTDYVVIQVWAREHGRSAMYLVDQVRKKMDIVATCREIRALCDLYPKVRAVHIEKKANGPAVIRILGDIVSGIKSWPPAGQPQPSKSERANAVQPLMSQLYLPPTFAQGNRSTKGQDPAIWLPEYIQEHVRFPLARHDDQVDGTTMAMSVLHETANMSAYIESLTRPEFTGLGQLRHRAPGGLYSQRWS